DRALAWIEAVELRRRGGGKRYEARQIDAPRPDALGEQERQPHLDSRHPVPDLLEWRIRARVQLAGRIHAIGRMGRREHVEDAGLEAAPDELLVLLVARRRTAHAARALDARLVEIVLGEEQVLRAGLRVDLEATIAGPGDLVDRLATGDVHDQHRDV